MVNTASAPTPATKLSVVNLAARQRMLSQRTILQTLLAAEGSPPMLTAARQTFQLFCDSHDELMRTARQMEPALAQRITQTYRGAQGVGPVIDSFMQRARHALDAVERGSPLRERAIADLVATTDDVLVALNTATSAFDQIARHKEEQIMNELTHIVTDIQSVAREAKVVSFNAQVIAARAGDQARGFAVVANVLSGITTEIDRQSKRAMELTRKSRLAA
ncbi:MAG TPA: methyl-accepting chemotaxis protein [Burkholderiaceae bacterium]|nr:methyl-accepting chemotaxis protein [Burkholderiaceae bacterium]